MTGAPIKTTLGGKEYTLSPITLDGWGRISAILKGRKLDTLDAIWARVDKCPPRYQQTLIDSANREAAKPVSDADFGEFITSHDGLMHLFAEMLGPTHPDLVTAEAVKAAFGGVPLLHLQSLAGEASGLKDAKNSSGVAAAETNEPTAPTIPSPLVDSISA
jgi:hypothetical protein